MRKKSASKIRRMQRRAVERGEEYIYTPPLEETNAKNNSISIKERDKKYLKGDRRKIKIALKLQKDLEEIENNGNLRAKERRSQKRKAEAIALQEAGGNITVLDLFDEIESRKEGKKRKKNIDDSLDENRNKRKNPCILFVGQLSYNTTKSSLFRHIQQCLKNSNFIKDKKVETWSNVVISPEDLKIRILTDPKNNDKSRGMAFIETKDADLMYSCLQLHHTYLDGRRINIEKSSGGRKGNKKREEKIKTRRKEQQEYFSNAVDNIFKEYEDNGMVKDGEFDDNVLNLCKRHAPSLVNETLKTYVEKRNEITEKKLKNPSSYFTHIISNIAKQEEKPY